MNKTTITLRIYSLIYHYNYNPDRGQIVRKIYIYILGLRPSFLLTSDSKAMIGANTRAVGMTSPFTISNTFIPMLLRVRTAINIAMTCERQNASNLYYNNKMKDWTKNMYDQVG